MKAYILMKVFNDDTKIMVDVYLDYELITDEVIKLNNTPGGNYYYQIEEYNIVEKSEPTYDEIMTKINNIDLTNRYGLNFKVNILKRGSAYGRDNCLDWDEDRKGIEFYNERNGQFIARYYLSTLLEDYPRPYGLNLYGDVDEWIIDRDKMNELLGLLKELENCE